MASAVIGAGGGVTFAGLLAVAGFKVYKKIFDKQRHLIEADLVLLAAARTAVRKRLRSQFASGDETLLEVTKHAETKEYHLTHVTDFAQHFHDLHGL